MKECIITNCGKLGDFLLALPVASWLARERDCKIHFVLPECFPPFRNITKLLMLQPFTSRVTLVPFPVDHWDCGGQPYKFDPWEYLKKGKYINVDEVAETLVYNIGFRHYPNKYIPEFYAEEYGLGYDKDFTLRIWNEYTEDNSTPFPTNEILRTSEWGMPKAVPHAKPMPTDNDLLDLARQLSAAKEVHTWMTGVSILAWLARIPHTVHRVPGHAFWPLYYPPNDLRGITFVEHTEEELR